MTVNTLQVEGSLIGVQSGQHQVPAFAAGLGLLQPSGSPALSHSTAVSPSGDDPFSLDTRPVTPLDLFGTSTASSGRATHDDGYPQPHVPMGASALLDLTFEASAGNTGASAATVISDPLLQSDLMGLDLTFSADVPPPVEEELPQSTVTSQLPKTKELSPEMERMIDSLPDLSFMLSKVLMFPAVLTSNA